MDNLVSIRYKLKSYCYNSAIGELMLAINEVRDFVNDNAAVPTKQGAANI